MRKSNNHAHRKSASRASRAHALSPTHHPAVASSRMKNQMKNHMDAMDDAFFSPFFSMQRQMSQMMEESWKNLTNMPGMNMWDAAAITSQLKVDEDSDSFHFEARLPWIPENADMARAEISVHDGMIEITVPKVMMKSAKALADHALAASSKQS